TTEMRYFRAGKDIADAMTERFFDATSGGFFDVETAGESNGALGALSARRKPFQDSPTPAGNPSAAIALLRLHAYTNDANYKEKAEQTLEVFAGMAEQYGMFAGTYGVAGVLFSEPHTQIVVIGNDKLADELFREAQTPFLLSKALLRFATPPKASDLPPSLAETVPNLPGIAEGKSLAVICSGFSCQPPISDPQELRRALDQAQAAV